ncbi:MAG TPA: hypothetical protein ENJ57_04475, partial [Rhizobiales bacterium]|nr:hypothetical protein [Hyphomicrobiales bacterium]
PETVKNEYLTGWRACLGKLSNQRTLVLRDYHSPNLLWLAGRKGARRAGLIDFQDAVIGPPAYDLVSLLQDARVDVPPEREAVLFRLYAERAGFDAKTKQILQTDMALMGAQRAAKILGIFVRLARRDGKPGYLKHLPRVGAALARNLAHPALAPIQGWFARYLPQILAAPPARKPRVTSAMILAAGLGTRMRHLTANTPKPLVRVDGKALIDHVLERTRRAGIDHIVVNLHYRADQLQRHLEAKHLPHLAFSHERTALLDTGGGVRKALPKLGAGAFFILNTDSLWLEGQESNLARMGKMWSADDMDFLLLLAPARGSLGYDGPGDFHLAQDGRLRRRGPDETAEFAHTGICITHPGAFANSPSGAFSLNLLWDRALAGGRLFGLPLSGEWMHVGTPESVEQATRRLREKSG